MNALKVKECLSQLAQLFTIDNGNEMGKFEHTNLEASGDPILRLDITQREFLEFKYLINQALSGEHMKGRGNR